MFWKKQWSSGGLKKLIRKTDDTREDWPQAVAHALHTLDDG